jgi:hypothetical protein
MSKSFFKELARVAREKNVHRRIGRKTRELAERFRIREIIGLDVSEALVLVEDLVDVYVRNLSERERFLKTRTRALFLPHCSRKYMDSRCRARFDPNVPSYYCGRCSPDCLINQATKLGRERGYDVYVLAGGSCIPKILKSNRYEGVVGVACSHEIKLGYNHLKSMGLSGQGIPLAKNGCANTTFSIESLEKTL